MRLPIKPVMPLLLCTAVSCGDRSDTGDALPEPAVLEVPAAPGAAQPFAASDGERLYLSWTETAPAGHALRFAAWDGSTWSEPQTVADGADWFVNWADFPSVVPLDDGTLLAHWLQRSGPGRYSYDVMVRSSADGGASWSEPVRPHRDGTETEHGFVTLFPHAQGAGAVWLDGRHYDEGAHGAATNEMQLRFTTFQGGVPAEEQVIDDRVCDCCQTAVALTAQGPVVAYRGRSPDEVRDIYVARLSGGVWTEPFPVHEDGWVINACPVNGPAADGSGNDVVVAWFTAADDEPRVRVAFSGDAGATFGTPVTVDDGQPIGRVDVLLVDGDAFVVWMERKGEDAEIRGRRVNRDGGVGASRPLAATTAARAGGFPRMARRGNDVVLAWTEPGEPSHIRAALLPLGRR